MAGEELNLVDSRIETLFESGSPADPIPPIATVISPPVGTDVEPDTVIVVEITDNNAVALSPLYAEFPGWPSAEMVYNGTSFLTPYAALSAAVDLGNGGVRLSVRRSDSGGGGWPGNVSLTFLATDTGGNIIT